MNALREVGLFTWVIMPSSAKAPVKLHDWCTTGLSQRGAEARRGSVADIDDRSRAAAASAVAGAALQVRRPQGHGQ